MAEGKDKGPHGGNPGPCLTKSQSLSESALSLARTAVVDWLLANRDSLAKFEPRPRLFPVVGGGFVDGLVSTGSDLDLSVIVDGQTQSDMARLQADYARCMSQLDARLKVLGLRGLCRIGRRIRRADEFLGLDRCHESRAAVMRTGVALNYILSCELLDLDVRPKDLGVRLATRAELLRLKERLYGQYRESLGIGCVPMLPYLLRRPGSHTPSRVKVQTQVAVNNILLDSIGIPSIAGSLNQRIAIVVELLEKGAGEDARARMKDCFFTATALIEEVKESASRTGGLRRKSFHHLLTKGHIGDERWQCLRELCRYLHEQVVLRGMAQIHARPMGGGFAMGNSFKRSLPCRRRAQGGFR